MAVDTAAKRASVISYALSPRTLVPPDGTIAQGDRQTISHMYGGILASAPSGGVFTPYFYREHIARAA